jgi:hypothetical protein
MQHLLRNARHQYLLVCAGCVIHAALMARAFAHFPLGLSFIVLAAWPLWIFALWRFRLAMMILPLLCGFILILLAFSAYVLGLAT